MNSGWAAKTRAEDILLQDKSLVSSKCRIFSNALEQRIQKGLSPVAEGDTVSAMFALD